MPFVFVMCPLSPIDFLFASHRIAFEAFVKSCKVAGDSSRSAWNTEEREHPSGGIEYLPSSTTGTGRYRPHRLDGVAHARNGYWVHTANRAVRSGGSAYALAPRTAERIGSLKLKMLQVITAISLGTRLALRISVE